MMLLPEDPEKRPGLWDSVATQLAQEAMCFLITNGKGDTSEKAREPNRNMAELAISRLRSAQICRISANHGKAVSPHFAGKREGDMVSLTELLTYPSEGASTVGNEKLKRDLETAVINLLFAEDGVSVVSVPLHIEPWVMKDAKICSTQEGLLFRRKG